MRQSSLPLLILMLAVSGIARAGDLATSLINAIKRGHKDEVVALLKAGADPCGEDKDGFPVLLHAADRGMLELFKAKHPTLPQKCSAHFQSAFGRNRLSILGLTVSDGKTDLAQWMLDGGAHPDAGDPLCMATKLLSRDLADRLLAAGAEPKKSDALLYAVRRHRKYGVGNWAEEKPEDLHFIRFLLRAGADVNHPKVLTEAVRTRKPQVVALLVGAGARVQGYEQNAIDMADSYGDKEVIAELKKASAEPDVATVTALRLMMVSRAMLPGGATARVPDKEVTGSHLLADLITFGPQVALMPYTLGYKGVKFRLAKRSAKVIFSALKGPHSARLPMWTEKEGKVEYEEISGSELKAEFKDFAAGVAKKLGRELTEELGKQVADQVIHYAGHELPRTWEIKRRGKLKDYVLSRFDQLGIS